MCVVCVYWCNNMIGLYQSALRLPPVLTCLHFYISPVSLRTCPSSCNFPSSSFSFLFFYYEEVLTLYSGRGWVSLSGFLQSSLFHPGIKFPAYLTTPLCTATTASSSQEELCECSRCVSCMYVFHSVGVSLPTCVKVSVKFINHS